MNEEKPKRKLKKNIFKNLLLILSLFSVIANFLITLSFHQNEDLLINVISSLIICIFTIFFIFSSIRNGKKRFSIILATLFLILFNGFQICNHLGLLTSLKIPHIEDFTNKSLVEAIKWGEKNRIQIDQVYEFSDTVDEYHIIHQDIAKNTLLKGIKKIQLVVSEGPNPDKEIVIPNMETWDADQVLTYLKKNYLNHVNIEFTPSDKNKDTVISQSKSGSIKRSDEIDFVFSLGDEENLEDTKLIDLTNKSRLEAEFYLKRHAIKYDIEEAFSSKISRGNVIKTDKKIGTMIKPNDEENKVKLTISKGPKIKVPDLTKYDLLEITNWVIKNKLKLEFNDRYDDSVKAGKVIEANYKEKDIIEQKTLIKVSISKGKLIMLSFKSLDEFRNWADQYHIHYEEKYEFSNEHEDGKIINFSHKTGDTIKNEDTIIVTISQGKKTKVPNVLNLNKKEASKKLEAAKLKYNFVYENSTKNKDIVINQSLSSGNEVAQNTTITITLSNGKRKEENSSSKPNKNTQNHSNQSTGDTTHPQDECDKSKTVTVVFQGSLNGSSLSDTATRYRNAYPNVKFSFVPKPSDVGNNGMVHRDSTSKGSFQANYCDTYTIYIVQN